MGEKIFIEANRFFPNENGARAADVNGNGTIDSTTINF